MAGPHNVETLVVLQPIAVDTDSSDSKGMLVLANGMLVALLVQLNHSEEKQTGRGFIEPALVGSEICGSDPSIPSMKRPAGSGSR